MQITDDEILEMLKNGKYRADLETSQIFNASGTEITKEAHGRLGGYQSVRLKQGPYRRKIRVALLVWMAGTLSVKPVGWQIHHLDGDCTNDSFANLYCLHPVDHRKIHQEETEVPF